MRVEMAAGWEEEVLDSTDHLFETKLGPQLERDAKRAAPIGPSWGYDSRHPRVAPHQGGELYESIKHHVADHTLVVDSDAPYAGYVEMGTRPHVIRSLVMGENAEIPRSAALGRRQVWNLWSPVTNQYFGPEVNHPGTRPQSFLRAALLQARSE